ncbi:sodium:proton antiporter [Desulfobotulus sp.]|jgi:Na+/H+ antiporter NhaD/arsenite permease-like protein|uniref:sodium:proton antiporter n=1 Tax=Desulfobotulus sp. TaxID=1940337 RepID=UPI002A3589E4|nr:sodium:proton antiporter [Desulfobotulus sp.]MDY0162720.1 sodium:proton antiporter [Desulfobotulus sp.]
MLNWRSPKFPAVLATVLTALFLPVLAFAADAGHHGGPHLDGALLSGIWVIPFACMLLSIAIFPLTMPHFWHHHFGKISLLWALAFLIPFTIQFGFSLALYETVHTLFLEYIPFIILLFSLFTVAGGVRLKGSLVGTPLLNTTILLVGTLLASWMGTTGAAMLLIRPLLRANAHRRFKVHSVVFFIFLVANIGGSLTPLGDPPLFLGFLKGVSFFWTTIHMFLPMVILSAILLTLFFILDSVLFAKEGKPMPKGEAAGKGEKFGIEGTVNLLLLLGVVGSVLLSGMWNPHISVTLYHVPIELQNIARDVLLLVIAGLSLKLTHPESRKKNDFNWFPILEVGKLFFGIFISMIPAIAILKAGEKGALASVINLVSHNGEPVNLMYFWLTGVLSSFLDNAPTYLVFFNTAGGDAAHLMTDMADTLLAISAGAVFMGANTYIGNAPNFMVRSIAEDQGVKMPSFFGYMAWSIGILVPCFVLISLIFF